MAFGRSNWRQRTDFKKIKSSVSAFLQHFRFHRKIWRHDHQIPVDLMRKSPAVHFGTESAGWDCASRMVPKNVSLPEKSALFYSRFFKTPHKSSGQ